MTPFAEISTDRIERMRADYIALGPYYPARMGSLVMALDEIIRLRKNLTAITAASAPNPDRLQELEERMQAVEAFLNL